MTAYSTGALIPQHRYLKRKQPPVGTEEEAGLAPGPDWTSWIILGQPSSASIRTSDLQVRSLTLIPTALPAYRMQLTDTDVLGIAIVFT